jgi:hypothetical protein
MLATFTLIVTLFMLHSKSMPNKADPAIKFLIQQLTDKKLDPRPDSESVIDLCKNDTTIREEIRHQLRLTLAQ